MKCLNVIIIIFPFFTGWLWWFVERGGISVGISLLCLPGKFYYYSYKWCTVFPFITLSNACVYLSRLTRSLSFSHTVSSVLVPYLPEEAEILYSPDSHHLMQCFSLWPEEHLAAGLPHVRGLPLHVAYPPPQTAGQEHGLWSMRTSAGHGQQ